MHRMKLLYPISIFLLLLISFSSCSDDTVVGNGLFENEELSLEHISDTGMTARTIKGDSVLTFLSGSATRQTYFLGELDDPNFGKSSSQIYLTCGRAGNAPADFSEVTEDLLDSIVLALKLDTLGFYGDRDATFNIKVYRMTEDISERDSIYSDEDFMTDPILLGEVNNFRPAASATDTLKIIEEGGESVYGGVGQIRIPLDINLAKEIIADVEGVKEDSTFVELLNGLYIVAEPSSSSMIAVDLSPATYQTRLSELAIFYADTSKYSFAAGIVKTSRMSNDYAGSSVEEAIGGSFTFGDSLLFIESMSGTDIEFELPTDLTQYNDRLLNFAELEMTVATYNTISDYNVDEYPSIDLLLPSSNNEDGDLNVLADFFVLDENGFRPSLMEQVEGGLTIYKFRIPITEYVRNIIQGTNFDNTLTFSTFLKSQRPNKSVIYGTGHSTYPSKLKLTFTKK